MELQCNSRMKAESKLRGNGELILVVEDNPNLRELLASVLEAFNYRVLTAFTAELALELWQKRTERIPVVLADFMLPTTNGLVLATELQKQEPELKVIFTSGELGMDAIKNSIPRNWAFLEKPFSHIAILKKLKQALDPEFHLVA